MSRFLFLVSFSLLISLSLWAEERSAILDCDTLSLLTNSSALTQNKKVNWAFKYDISASNQYLHGDKKCLQLNSGYTENTLIASYVGGATNDIPNIRSFSFMARVQYPQESYPIQNFSIAYRVNGGKWQTERVVCSFDKSSLTTEWQTFNVTFLDDFITAELMISVCPNYNTVLLDDLTITYDPDYVAPSPEPTPDPCANCFQVTF